MPGASGWFETPIRRTTATPHADNLKGRSAVAATESHELGNKRTRAEIDALNRELALKDRSMALDEEMRRKSSSDTDTIRDLLLKQFGGAGMPGGAPAPIGTGGAPSMPAPAPPGASSIPGAAAPVADQSFARAKDRAGLSLQSGLRTLKGVMQRGGQSGSSIERDAIGGLIGGETQRLADVDLESAAVGQRRGFDLEDRAHDDQWREREFQDKTRTNGLEMLLRLMTASRAY